VLKADLIEYLQKVNLPKKKLRDIYSKSRAKNIASRTPQLQFDAPETVVDLLWDMQAPKNENHISHPVIDFALRLLHWSQEQDNRAELSVQLQEWIERARLIFSWTPENIQSRQQKINAESNIKIENESYAYLMVELAPNAIHDSNQYHVEFTLWNAEGKQRPLRQPEISVTQKNISDVLPQLLTEVLDESESDWGTEKLALEFSLPFNLFSLNLHEWKDSELENRFSAEYPVYVRSWKRFDAHKKSRREANKIKAQWRKCWDYFSEQTHVCQFQDEHVFWIEAEEIENCHDPTIWSDEFDECRDKHCAIFTFDPCQLEMKTKILGRMTLHAGLISAVWVREPCPLDSVDVKQKINQSLNQRHLQGMAQELKAQRKKYRRDPRHIANHLMVMWDTPERIPAKYKSGADYR